MTGHGERDHFGNFSFGSIGESRLKLQNSLLYLLMNVKHCGAIALESSYYSQILNTKIPENLA